MRLVLALLEILFPDPRWLPAPIQVVLRSAAYLRDEISSCILVDPVIEIFFLMLTWVCYSLFGTTEELLMNL